ncbi:hypothetical protein [Enterococcus massiliensis]|uniref:hypothetical protein n=1 Tax=Enterococcus massiliensis TaxID=1640685 RepID=UPI00065DD01E|nr:hypothetical protein [Enterococcus massiliensis]
MKDLTKKIMIASMSLMSVLALVSPGAVYAAEVVKDSSKISDVQEVNNFENGNIAELESGVSVEIDEDSGIIVTKHEGMERANVSKWGAWTYTNIAVTTGVAANAINAAFYAGLGASVAMFGIPGWAIGGLLTGASWTNLGSSPGRAVAKKWDTSGNGWIGFYMSKGYDGAGRHVATRYKTK